MSVLRRYFQPNQTCFVTSVTYKRAPILIEHGDLLWQAVERTQEVLPFELLSWVIMPDHWHLILSSERGDFSELLKRLKLSFAAAYRQRIGRVRGTVWQARYWDHIIRDEKDLKRHFDYIHYNPVKHGLVADPFAWRESSIHKWFRQDGSKRWMHLAMDDDGEYGE